MRRTDRLFQIIQLLRAERVLTARQLAERLEVSERTIYRHVQDLVASGVPVEGEAGVGYMLRGFDLPPLMFDQEEIEALVLGLRFIDSWADSSLAEAAKSVLMKVEQVLPDERVSLFRNTQLFVPEGPRATVTIDIASIRMDIRTQTRISMGYEDAEKAKSQRTIRPLALTFYGPVWLLLGWCELREDFRTFRLDRIRSVERLGTFDTEPGKTLDDFMLRLRESSGSDC